MDKLREQVQVIIGKAPEQIQSLRGGMIGTVYRVDLEGGDTIVAKVDEGTDANLSIEGSMLQYLGEHSDLPVPQIYFNSDQLLLMEFIEGSSSFHRQEEEHAAELLANLHTITAPAYGFDQDTRAGNSAQPNPWNKRWIAFFRENRLLEMSQQAYQIGHLPSSFLPRIEKMANDLEKWLFEPDYPSLLHGDVWTTNVLAKDGRITGFLDPATYYGHHEIELSFIALFNTFGSAFYNQYQEIKPIEPGFFEERVHIYNLYPLLVHVWHFNGGYVQAVDQTLRRFGY